MKKANFEWDDNKNISNQEKHHLSFEKAVNTHTLNHPYASTLGQTKAKKYS